jgi:geranylgeranyl diphosphate synthase type I
MSGTTTQTTAYFKTALKKHKQAIDADISNYIRYLKSSMIEQFGEGSRPALEAYCDILSRGGKRLRGALVIEGYTMCGGANRAMIMQAARAVEMIHAYLLIIDDIQDRSARRRGGPTAHVALGKATGDDHLGETLATNAALLGCHAAMTILANLDAPAELRSNVLSIMNRTLVVTAHGQIADALQTAESTETDVKKVQEWKTATYTILNPLHVGMVLAGVGCEVTDAITPYAMAVGQAFQNKDDIIGVFGDNAKTGKDFMDDIREGKQTLLTVKALAKANKDDKVFLLSMLGNAQLTPVEFRRCQAIITQTGALTYAQEEIRTSVDQALSALQGGEQYWSLQGQQFLTELTQELL